MSTAPTVVEATRSAQSVTEKESSHQVTPERTGWREGITTTDMEKEMDNVEEMINKVVDLTDAEFKALDTLRRKAGQGSLTDAFNHIASATFCAKRWKYRTEKMEDLHQIAMAKHPSMTYAWSAIHEAVQAEIAKDLIGEKTHVGEGSLRQVDYDTLISSWDSVLGTN